VHNRIFEHVAQFARINLYCANLHIQGRSTFLLTDLTHRDIMKVSYNSHYKNLHYEIVIRHNFPNIFQLTVNVFNLLLTDKNTYRY